MNDTFLGLGSNVGMREQNLLSAVSLLRKRFEILDISSIYSTAPVGYTDQNDFLNMVIRADTRSTEPLILLRYVKAAEEELGRKKTFRWGPRLIDIDILYKEGIRCNTEALTIPHRELFRRNFVLIPLSEITDHLVIDGEKIFIRQYVNSDTGGEVTLYKSKDEIVIDGQR